LRRWRGHLAPSSGELAPLARDPSGAFLRETSEATTASAPSCLAAGGLRRRGPQRAGPSGATLRGAPPAGRTRPGGGRISPQGGLKTFDDAANKSYDDVFIEINEKMGAQVNVTDKEENKFYEESLHILDLLILLTGQSGATLRG
jgi:hypothetical protein